MKNTITTFEWEAAKTGMFPEVVGKAIIKSGAVLEAGSLLGEHSDGTSNIAGEADYTDINAILIEGVDATAGDTEVDVILTGEFNQEYLKVKGGSDITTFIKAARKNSIFIKEVY